MQFKETLSVAVDALRANKLRAVLTSIGVIIGSASIVLVVTVALTSQKYVISQIEAVGSNLIWAEMVKTPDKVQPLSHQLTLGDMEAVKETIPGVTNVAGISDMPMTVVVNGQPKAVALIGVTHGYQEIRRLVVLRGRYFRFRGYGGAKQGLLDHQGTGDWKCSALENPIGRPLRMEELTFTVIGVFQERVATYGLSEMQEGVRADSVAADEVLHRDEEVLSTLYAQASTPDKSVP